MKAKVSFIFLVFIIFSLFYGCSKDRVVELKKERLFSIQIGRGEEEIGVRREENGQFFGPESILFKNGFFYVVDSVNQKILKITTPGDIILTLSKGLMEKKQEENVLRTKQRNYFGFNQIGMIAVDNENCIYVEDKFLQKKPEKIEIDLLGTEIALKNENGDVYMSNIMKFDRLGKFIYKLGKSGINSDPFYNIYKIDADEDGKLIVLTTDDDWESWTFYKFDQEGNLIFKRELISDEIVALKETGDTSLFIMDLVPVYSGNYLLFWISLYETTYDTKEAKEEEELWGEEIEIEKIEKQEKEEKLIEKEYIRDLVYYRLLYYDLESMEIKRSYTWENRIGNKIESTEEFLGIDRETHGFLWKFVNSTKSIITIFQSNGTLLAKRSFVFEDDGIWTNVHVDVDGSVSALKIDDRFIHFYKWRSDKLITGEPEKVTVKEFFKEKIEEFKNANR